MGGIIIVLALARLFDLATSFNGEIIMYSKFFKFNFWSGVLMVVIGIATNLVFIPIYGILGAAIATALTLTFINTIKIIFIYIKMGFLPFNSNMLVALFIGLVVLSVDYLTPELENVYLNLLARSALVVLIFFPLLIGFKVSSDINETIRTMINKLKEVLV